MNGFFLITAHAQIRSDFIFSDQGGPFDLKLDSEGFLHFTWRPRDYGTFYGLLDSLGQMIKDPVIIAAHGGAPFISVNTQYVIVVWNLTGAHGSYIYGQLLTIQGEPVGGTIKIDDGGEGRGLPDACFLNDTTFVVVWAGDGPDTPNIGVYGQIMTTSFQFIGGNLLLTDHGFENVGHGLSHVMCCPKNDDFVVVWKDDYLGSYNIFGRLFHKDGTPKGPSFIITDYPELDRIVYLNTSMDS
jgi:hypothetical protein